MGTVPAGAVRFDTDRPGRRCRAENRGRPATSALWRVGGPARGGWRVANPLAPDDYALARVILGPWCRAAPRDRDGAASAPPETWEGDGDGEQVGNLLGTLVRGEDSGAVRLERFLPS